MVDLYELEVSMIGYHDIEVYNPVVSCRSFLFSNLWPS